MKLSPVCILSVLFPWKMLTSTVRHLCNYRPAQSYLRCWCSNKMNRDMAFVDFSLSEEPPSTWFPTLGISPKYGGPLSSPLTCGCSAESGRKILRRVGWGDVMGRGCQSCSTQSVSDSEGSGPSSLPASAPGRCLEAQFPNLPSLPAVGLLVRANKGHVTRQAVCANSETDHF